MDEEEKKDGEQVENEQANPAEDAANAVQDTAEMAKEAVDLVKNVETGNVLGIAQNAINLLKNKQFRKKIIISAITPIISIILVAGLFMGVLNAVGEFFSDLGQGLIDLGEAVIQAFKPRVDDTGIQISDEQVDYVIKSIEDMGISLEGLKLIGDVDYSNPDNEEANKEALRKYIRKFYQAQEVTRTLNTRPNKEETELAGENPFGQVYPHRAIIRNTSEDENDEIDILTLDQLGEIKATKENQLEYIKYESFLDLVNIARNSQYSRETDRVLGYFSIDPENGNMVYATLKQKRYEGGGDIISQELEVKSIDYKSAISQYTTPMDFFIYLAMISQNPEFVSKVADLVEQCEIRMMILDEVYTSTENVTNTYTLNEKDIINTGTAEAPVYEQDGEIRSEEITETGKGVQNTTWKPKIVVTYVQTWFSEQEITYELSTEGTLYEEGTSESNEIVQEHADEEEPTEYTQEGTLQWKTNQKTIITTSDSTIKYNAKVVGDVIDRTGNKGDQGVNSEGKVDENTTFIGLLDDEFEIPNSSRKEKAGSNLVSGAELLFDLLSKNAQAQHLEVMMRYVLNKYQNTNKYGDQTWEDVAALIEIHEIAIGSNYNVNTKMGVKEHCITDPKILKDAIEKLYTGQRKENLTKEVNNFLKMQSEYNVNAVFAMAVTIVESGGGTNWDAIDSSTYNWYSITGSYNGQSYRDPNSSNELTWRVYPSFGEATMDFGNLIANSDYYFKAGKYTVEEIAPIYCSKEWGQSVISIMNEIFMAAGIDVNTDGYIAGGFLTGGVQTDAEAAQLQSYIETELISTIEHTDGSYQNGPFASWWQHNLSDPFQCPWWVYGRASMYLGRNYPKDSTGMIGNGNQWYQKNVDNGWFAYGNEPRPNSIISWSKGAYGHVAYVEGVTHDGIYISHAGNGTSWFGVDKIPLDGSFSGYTLNGYIYLDEPLQ